MHLDFHEKTRYEFYTFYFGPTTNWGNTNHEFSGFSLINQMFFYEKMIQINNQDL